MRKEVVSGEELETSGHSASLLKAIRQIGRRRDFMELLTDGFCARCRVLFHGRFEDLYNGKFDLLSSSNGNYSDNFDDFCTVDSSSLWSPRKRTTSYRKSPHLHERTAHSLGRTPEPIFSVRHQQMSYSDSFPASVKSQRHSLDEYEESLHDDLNEMSRVRRKGFTCIERINGRPVNIVSGLELHTRVFNELEQEKIIDFVYEIQRLGQEGRLRERTYSEPKKWMRGKGRVTIQFGCCYNYAEDKKGNPPGILQDEEVDPMPTFFKSMIKRLIRWHVLPPTCVPNSCIVNIYDEGDCIPPHIDHHDFVRPFCTVSLLTECDILFGSNLKILGPGEFSGPVAIPLPVGSVLVLKGNGSDVAKHCVPGVPAKRISITFRKMDDSKLPFKFKPDPELQDLQSYSPRTKSSVQQVPPPNHIHRNPFHPGEQDFPQFGVPNSRDRTRPNKRSFH